jgi:hypothetical protein
MSRELPIGRCENVKMESGALVGTIVFASEKANPKAEQCFQLFRENVLRSVSVGFIPHSYRWEKQDDIEVLILDDNELVELSATPTPANPDALVRMRAKALEARAKALPPKETNQRALPNDTAPAGKTGVAANEEEGTNAMDLKELTAAIEAKTKELSETTAKLAASEGQVAGLTKQIENEKAKTDALNERCATLEKERNTHQEAAAKATAQLVDRDLEQLVGVKIAPAEKPGLAKLASLSPELYAEQLAAIKARPDMKILGGPVVGADPAPPPPTQAEPSTAVSGKSLESELEKDLNASAA